MRRGFDRHTMRPLYFLLTILVGSFAVADETRKPNLIMFLVDDMGWMDSEPYGSQYYETPNFTRFAKEAMRFTDAYSQPLCSPTRATILSGQYPSRHGITSASGHQPADPEGASPYPDKTSPNQPVIYPKSKNYFDPGIISLPERLRDAGYRSGHIGKWHLGTAPEHRPTAQGFDEAWFCVPDPGPPGYFSPYGVVTEGRPTGKSKIGTITDGPEGEYITDRLTDEAVRFIRENRDRPFYLNLWQYGVHGPWGHKEAYTAEFAKQKDPRGLQGNPIMASMLKSVDESLGRIMDTLDELGLAEKTFMVVTSDNGGNVHSNVPGERKTEKAEEGAKSGLIKDWRKWAGDLPPTNNSPLREGKGRIYEGGQRVPLMVRWPGRIAAGATSGTVVHAVDYYPTFLDVAGVEVSDAQPQDGLSLLPVLEGKGGLEREAIFTWFPHLVPAVSVRAGDWKLIRRWEPHREYPEIRELYNLREDQGETKNLAPALPGKVAELDALIDRFIAETKPVQPIPNPGYRAPAPAQGKPAAVKTTEGLVVRKGTMEIAEGALRVIATGGEPFLGTAQGRVSGPVKIRLRMRAATGGGARFAWKAPDQADFQEGQVVDYTLSGGGQWQEIEADLPVTGSLGTLRLYLPAKSGETVEIASIRIEGAKGAPKVWEFAP